MRRRVFDLMAYPTVSMDQIREIWPELNDLDTKILEQVEIDAQYAGYLGRQEADIRAFRRDENLRIPADFDYSLVKGLSNEVRAKLERGKPVSLGQASRLEGITPASLTVLLLYLKRERRQKAG